MFKEYSDRLQQVLKDFDWQQLEPLADALNKAWKGGQRVFLCGNGGSAANAIHIANDFLYGVGGEDGLGLKVNALSANSAVLTCLGNDTSYEEIFSRQLRVQAEKGDILIILSGSGNSGNIVAALEEARKLEVKSFAILGFSGGKCLAIADHSIHFAIDDMQISEDCQMIVGHMLMKFLRKEGSL